MARWNIQPSYKKSVIERTHFYKEGKSIIIETGWRWGEFICETEDDNPPLIENGTDLFDCGYEVELQECFDGCWEEREFYGFTEEEQSAMEEWLDENSAWDLESEGWDFGDSEMIMGCDPVIERVEE